MEPVNFSSIFSYGVQMTITFLVGLGLYTIKVAMSKTETVAWYQANALGIGVSLVLFWLISAGLVIVPSFASLLGAFGFNADVSPAGIALVVVGFLIGGAANGKSTRTSDL